MPPSDSMTPVPPGSPLKLLTQAVRAWVRREFPEHADHRLQIEGVGEVVRVTCLPCDVDLEKDRPKPLSSPAP